METGKHRIINKLLVPEDTLNQLIEWYQKEPCFIDTIRDECFNAYANADIVSTEFTPLLTRLLKVARSRRG